MSDHRYSLEKYSGIKSKHICPNCGKRELVLYIDQETGKLLHETVGKCNKLEKCGYHYPPRLYFSDTGLKPEKISKLPTNFIKQQVKPTFFCEENDLLESLHSVANTSNLFEFFCTIFEQKKVEKTFQKYAVGAYGKVDFQNKNFYKSTIFWQVDRENKIRCGKVMQYNPEDGKRIKDQKKFRFKWIRNENEETEMRQVFFGTHLLKYFPNHKIGIVESEKTALLCDLFFDEKILWLSAGSLEGLNERKFKDLEGRKVILFPDLSSENSKKPAYEYWKSKAKSIGSQLYISIKINDYLKLFSAPIDRENQFDLGDFIIREKKIKYRI